MSVRQLELKLIPVSKKLTAKLQLHRGKAYFDTWLAKYPDWRGNFSNVVCGNI